MKPRVLTISLVGCALGINCETSKVPTFPPDAAEHAPKARTVNIDAALLSSGRVKIGAIERRVATGEIRVAGEVQSSHAGTAEAGALVSGRIAALGVEEGATVRKGQVLAWVDAPEVGRATADVLRARSRAAVAIRKLQRQIELQQQSATSKNAVDEARAEDETARADLLASRTLLANLGADEPQVDLDSEEALVVRVPVRAPMAGIVARRSAILGGAVAPDTALFRIVAAKKLLVAARIPETIVRPRDGALATISARGGASTPCKASVAGSLGVVDEATRTLTLQLKPDEACTSLVPGGYVDVTFEMGGAGQPELVLPREAVVNVKGVPSVFVVGATESEFTLHTVRLRAGDEAEAVVEDGVAEGQRVAVRGAVLLKGELLRTELEGQ